MLTAADTAYAIAHVRALESERTDRLFDDPYARIFADAGAHAREGTERFLALPMFTDAVRLRTRALDDLVRDALGGGIRQIVFMGAGFDARALRMPEIAASGARVFEVDFEAQLATKRVLLEAAGVALPAFVAHVPCDFAQPDFDVALEASLVARGFRVGAGAVFVWEGVLAYITHEAADRTLRFMARVGGPSSRVGFDFAPIAFDVPAEERVVRAGFSRFVATSCEALWRRHLPGEPHPNASVTAIGVAYV